MSRHLSPGMCKWYKNDLLYNKIECYNIAVQRRLNIKKIPCWLRAVVLLRSFIYVQTFISRHVKMIQNALLYNKIECYNIAVQRRLNIKVAKKTKHQKSPCWLRAIFFLRSGGSRILRFQLTLQSAGIRSFVDEHLFTRRLSSEHGVSSMSLLG